MKSKYSDQIKAWGASGAHKEPDFFDKFCDLVIQPHLATWSVAEMKGDDYQCCLQWGLQAAAAKNEDEYVADGRSLATRFRMLALTEMACEKLLGLPRGSIFDPAIGNNRDFNRSDLHKAGYLIGIKAAQFPKPPLYNVKEPIQESQVVCMVQWGNEEKLRDKAWVYLCGVGLAADLRENSEPFLVADSNLRERGTKNGIYCFDLLKPAYDLKKFC